MKSKGWTFAGRSWLAVLALTVVAQWAPAQQYQVIHEFQNGLDGATPSAGLAMDKAGNLYGGASGGGDAGYGTIFRLRSVNGSWVFTTLYSFQGGNDGASPGTVVVGPDGLLYGATTEGGGDGCGGVGCGTIFSLRPPSRACTSALCPWSENVLYRFQGSPDAAVPATTATVVFDQAGNIYGSTVFGGDNNLGAVYELTKSSGSWAGSVIYSFTGSDDGNQPNSPLIFDDAGNLYGTAFGVGPSLGSVYELSPSDSGWTENTLYDFQDGDDGAHPSAGVIFDDSGNLFGVTQEGGVGTGGVFFELTPNGLFWDFSTQYSFTGPLFGGPNSSLIMDAKGNLYGTTYLDGQYNRGAAFKLALKVNGDEWIYTSLQDFTGGTDGGYPIGGLLRDANGNLYGTASSGGAHYDYGVVFQITP